MIEMTAEMRMVGYQTARAWATEHGHQQPDDRMLNAALAAVLAIVERDHCLKPKGHVPKVALVGATCPETLETRGTVVRCQKKPNHLDDAHLARHDGWDVIW